MSSLPPFSLPGSWYKGNLHTHTTESDGKVTVAENIQWHADHGYHFLTITDHNRVTDPYAFVENPPLLPIRSVEISARRPPVDYHILAIGVDSMPIPHLGDPQATIESINAAGGLSIVAHPYWHDHTFDDLLCLS